MIVAISVVSCLAVYWQWFVRCVAVVCKRSALTAISTAPTNCLQRSGLSFYRILHTDRRHTDRQTDHIQTAISTAPTNCLQRSGLSFYRIPHTDRRHRQTTHRQTDRPHTDCYIYCTNELLAALRFVFLSYSTHRQTIHRQTDRPHTDCCIYCTNELLAALRFVLVLTVARISHRNSVFWSVCPSVMTRYRLKPRWDRDSGFLPYDSVESLVSCNQISCRWVRRFPLNENPLRNRYFTTISLSSVRTVAGRHRKTCCLS